MQHLHRPTASVTKQHLYVQKKQPEIQGGHTGFACQLRFIHCRIIGLVGINQLLSEKLASLALGSCTPRIGERTILACRVFKYAGAVQLWGRPRNSGYNFLHVMLSLKQDHARMWSTCNGEMLMEH